MRIGIDLGGTKIEAIALDDKGMERFRRRVPTPHEDYAAIIGAICDLVACAERETGVTATVGVGTPGAIHPSTGRLKNSNTLCLNGQPLLRDLQTALQRDVRIQNDANCFAVSEATDGAAAAAHVVFGAILGTGVGGGVVVGGAPIVGANAIGGEWGHNPLPYPRDDERPGVRCYCGRMGCIETWLSGTGFAARFRENGADGDGTLADARSIVEAAKQGNTRAETALHDYEDRLARSLAMVINLLDPAVIVLGGGMSNIERLYTHVPRLWGQYVFSDHIATRLVPPAFGDSSGVRGAAWLWEAQRKPVATPFL
jgi:fructokinase